MKKTWKKAKAIEPAFLMSTMSNLTQTIEAAAEAVLTLVEGLEREEFMRSRLTRPVVTAHLLKIAHALAETPASSRSAMPEFDWDAWQSMGARITSNDDVLWFAIHALTPPTLSWARFYAHAENASENLQH